MKLFDRIKIRAPKLNKFDLSHERKMSLEMGYLVPMMVEEVLPGDRFRVNSEVFLRFAPLIAPIMHRVNVFVHYFYVPNRLVWSEWKDFITGGRLGTSEPVHPYIRIKTANVANGEFDVGSLADYFGVTSQTGIPDGSTVDREYNISALPFRAYQLIYDEYYRDQNLMASLDLSLASGEVTGAEFTKITTLRKRAWEKDYFTSALPFAQRGDEILMPLAGDVSVTYKPSSDVIITSTGLPTAADGFLGHNDSVPGKMYAEMTALNTGSPGRIENIDSAQVDASSVSINDLRLAVRLQEWLEKSARAGSRYVEQLLAFFGVNGGDARLQRPEYLGGGKAPVQISEVVSTSEVTALPQGNMAGHGYALGSRNGFKYRFPEHGFVIGIMSVLPTTAYQGNIHRKWRRFDKFDYAWPELAHLGEQGITQEEVDYNYADTTVYPTWGYQSRYAEYKYGCSSVHGDFRSQLAFWHMGRIFGGPPELTTDFVTADPTNRIFAVESPPGAGHHLYAQIYNSIDALRPLPYFGTPSL